MVAVLIGGPAQGAEPAPSQRPGAVPARRAGTTALPDPARAKQVSLEELLAFADANAPRLLVSRSTRGLADAARVAASPLPAREPRAGDGSRSSLRHLGRRCRRRCGATRSGSTSLANAGGDDRLRSASASSPTRRSSRISGPCAPNVHGGFHRVLVMRERSSLAERVLAFQEDLLRVVKGQVKAGNVSPLMLRLAEAEVAQAKQA